ncbi:MAG: RHS repeat-associated core domain-containing protein, partial [Bacteroidota bacterium]
GYNSTISVASMVAAVASAFGGVNGGTEAQQAVYNGFDGALGTVGGTSNSTVPAAYLNYVFFDENLVSYQEGFKQISGAANTNHERVHFDDQTLQASKPGFVYIWVSNNSATTNWVYFDDLKVTLTEHPVIQTDDYYPFGLAHAGGFQRVTAKENQFKYNGKELIEDLGIDWYDYGARMYMADIGRWGAVDPLAEDYYGWSPYNYVMDNPIRHIDPDGRGVIDKVAGFFQKVKNFVSGNGFQTNGQMKLQGLRQEFNHANDVNGFISEVNDLNGFNIPLVDVPRDPDAMSISQHEPDVFETIESELEVKPDDGVGTVALKTAGDIVYGTVNDPYSVVAGETMGGDNLSATEQEDAIAGTVTTALSALKPLKALKTQNMGQFTKGKKGLFKNFKEAGNALKRSNASRRSSNAANKGATKQGRASTGVVDAVTKTKKNLDKTN